MTSRKPRKTDRGLKDFEALLNAIRSIKIDKKSVISAATAYDIKRTSLTRYIAKFDEVVPDISVVPDDELLKIVQRISTPYADTSKALLVRLNFNFG